MRRRLERLRVGAAARRKAGRAPTRALQPHPPAARRASQLLLPASDDCSPRQAFRVAHWVPLKGVLRGAGTGGGPPATGDRRAWAEPELGPRSRKRGLQFEASWPKAAGPAGAGAGCRLIERSPWRVGRPTGPIRPRADWLTKAPTPRLFKTNDAPLTWFDLGGRRLSSSDTHGIPTPISRFDLGGFHQRRFRPFKTNTNCQVPTVAAGVRQTLNYRSC